MYVLKKAVHGTSTHILRFIFYDREFVGFLTENTMNFPIALHKQYETKLKHKVEQYNLCKKKQEIFYNTSQFMRNFYFSYLFIEVN